MLITGFRGGPGQQDRVGIIVHSQKFGLPDVSPHVRMSSSRALRARVHMYVHIQTLHALSQGHCSCFLELRVKKASTILLVYIVIWTTSFKVLCVGVVVSAHWIYC